jgi:adenylate kinase
MSRIIITGTPGTGKSMIARRLASDLGAELIDIAMIARKSGLVQNHEVDIQKLRKKLAFLRGNKHFVAEGHLACEMTLPADFVFVLRCDPKTLARRLKKRNYPKKKLEENLVAEALDYCTQRVLANYKVKPLELETSGRSAAECAGRLSSAVKNKKKTLDNVDHSDYLLPRS